MNFGINENCSVINLTFNFHFCRKTNGQLGTRIISVSKLKIFKTFCFESPRVVTAIVWFLPMCTQLRKCTAADIVPSLTRLKSLISSWNSLSRFFENTIKPIYKIEESSNLWRLLNFSNLNFSCVQDYKATLSGGSNALRAAHNPL